MTYKQQERLLKLRTKVENTYRVFQANTEKNKHEKLAKQWLDAVASEEKFLEKIAF